MDWERLLANYDITDLTIAGIIEKEIKIEIEGLVADWKILRDDELEGSEAKEAVTTCIRELRKVFRKEEENQEEDLEG